MPSTDVLKQFGLSRNPFTDRTAEKTFHDGSSLYVHSDLQGFRPSGTAEQSNQHSFVRYADEHEAVLQKLHTYSSASEDLARLPLGCR